MPSSVRRTVAGVVREWTRRLFGRRFGPMRLALVAFGLGYLLLLRQPAQLGAMDWFVGLGVLGLSSLGGFRPLPVALGQAVMLALAELYAPAVMVEVKVGASAALFELAVRRWGRPTLVVGCAVMAAQLVGSRFVPAEVGPALYRAAVIVCVPVLLAGYIRSAELAARTAHERAREAEHSRDLAEWGARMGERAAIARELHDMVAHHLASTVLRVGVARHVLPRTDQRLAEVLDDVHASATTALTDLRRLLAALRDPVAPDSLPQHLAPLLAETTALPAAVQGVVEQSRQAGLSVDAEIGPEIAELDAIRSLTVLRLVQEGLANVTKHAGQYARVRLRVGMEDGALHLDLANDLPRGPGGLRGFGLPEGEGSGYGLLGMRERVALVGGTIDAGKTPEGWRLTADLPAADAYASGDGSGNGSGPDRS
ncbi:histidine kinase [Kitasatospora sp. GP82]|uniref:sensor histidine kinase n=1 Tax=Kitasatospora sp. GP82 TaxID=3035089 RepID=UPI002476661F|nr:histidine kinase [Kitasatospora sp. GP82]MDH6125230.1 signal transduction histidine kinase [Kitasatospora sp. GP82]